MALASMGGTMATKTETAQDASDEVFAALQSRGEMLAAVLSVLVRDAVQALPDEAAAEVAELLARAPRVDLLDVA
jgi:hypothetical protein